LIKARTSNKVRLSSFQS